MITSRREPGLRELIASDIAAWADQWSPDSRTGGGTPMRTALRLVWSYLGLRATILYRVSHALRRRGVRVLPAVLSHWNVTLHGIDIPPYTPIGPRMYVPHPVGTVVTARSIGAGVTLVSGVTIGMRNEPGFPVIGDNVFIGAGARVLGAITIGDDVSVGANAVVLADVPSGYVAVGVPAVARQRSSVSGAASNGNGARKVSA
jgi:serine O-acetyltransferase